MTPPVFILILTPRHHQIEHFHTDHTNSYTEYANPDAKAHGVLGYKAKSEKILELFG
jgi:hypothetical protein